MIQILFLTLITIYFLGCTPVQKREIYIEKKSDIEKKNNNKQKKLKHTIKFKLFISSPNATRIRILNIKPIYKNGIALKPGRYHIELSAKKYITYKKWITLQKNTTLNITLKEKKNPSLGFVHWKKISGMQYIDGVFWQDQTFNKEKKENWTKAYNYCQKLTIQVNKAISIDDFTLPNEKELLSLRKFKNKLQYVEAIYWSSLTDKKHPQFAKYFYINKEKSGWYNKNGKTYVRCVSRKYYPLHLTLQKLTKYLMEHNNYSYLEAYEFALNLKYGNPVIKVIRKEKEDKTSFILHSQKKDKNQNYFYKENINIEDGDKLLTNPDIKFEIINNKLIFRSIN